GHARRPVGFTGRAGANEPRGKLARALPGDHEHAAPAYLKRIPNLRTESLEVCYADPRVWDGFDPALTTLASPDPQAVRPPGQPKNVLQVGLPTNFKAAPFGPEEPTTLLRELEVDIDQARFDAGAGSVEVPVKLKVHDS